MSSFRLLLLPFAFCPHSSAHAKEVAYDVTRAKRQVDFAGKPVTAMTVNGGIPGPVLRFTEGDTAVIRVHNAMAVATDGMSPPRSFAPYCASVRSIRTGMVISNSVMTQTYERARTSK